MSHGEEKTTNENPYAPPKGPDRIAPLQTGVWYWFRDTALLVATAILVIAIAIVGFGAVLFFLVACVRYYHDR